MRKLNIHDWLTQDALVLSLEGVLDAEGCAQVAARLEHLLRWWPGIRVALELGPVTSVDAAAAEDLFLGLVAKRARSGMLLLVASRGPCRELLDRLEIPAATPDLGPGIALDAVFRPAVTT